MELEYLGDSTCVQAAGFDKGELTVQFQDGSIYTYTGVSPLIWYNFKRVTSKGWFFNKNIRNNYSFYEGGSDTISSTSGKMLNEIWGDAAEDIILE